MHDWYCSGRILRRTFRTLRITNFISNFSIKITIMIIERYFHRKSWLYYFKCTIVFFLLLLHFVNFEMNFVFSNSEDTTPLIAFWKFRLIFRFFSIIYHITKYRIIRAHGNNSENILKLQIKILAQNTNYFANLYIHIPHSKNLRYTSKFMRIPINCTSIRNIIFLILSLFLNNIRCYSIIASKNEKKSLERSVATRTVKI